MAEPQPKRARKSTFLLDLDGMEAQRVADKQTVKDVLNCYEQMRKMTLQCVDVRRLEKVNDEVKLSWVMAKYGVVAVLKVMVAMRVTPETLTAAQAQKCVCSMVAGSEETDTVTIYQFLSNCCTRAVEQVASCMRMDAEVMGPPTKECCGCGRQLVSYLTSNVRLYTCTGVKKIDKVALQCKQCRLIFNPTQFGNKHEVGLQFYPGEPAIIEVTDTIYFQRSLLEWQCCLA